MSGGQAEAGGCSVQTISQLIKYRNNKQSRTITLITCHSSRSNNFLLKHDNIYLDQVVLECWRVGSLYGKVQRG